MFNFKLTQKEIPDELKIVETVMDPSIKENLIADPNKFLLAEKNGTPLYKHISSFKLSEANDEKVFFFDIEELLKSPPRGVQNQIEERKVNYFTKTIYSSLETVANLLQMKKIKEKFRLFISDGFNQLGKEDLKTKEIKFLAVNCYGNFLAMINRNNLLIIVNILKKEGRLYNPKVSNLEEILFTTGEVVDINWSTVNPELLTIAYRDKILLLEVNSKSEVSTRKLIQKYTNITKFKSSSTSEQYLLLHNNGKTFTVLDSKLKYVYSKKFLLEAISDLTWSFDSSFFVLFSSHSLYLYNYLNMEFKSWTNFTGNIISANISKNSNCILVTTDDFTSPLYVIYNMTEDYYNFSYSDSYNNIPQNYLENEYKLSKKIFSLQSNETSSLVKCSLNSLNNRMVVLYKDNRTLKRELKIFEILNIKSVHEMRMNLICTFNNFRDMEVTDFDLKFDLVTHEDVLFIIWDEKLMSKSYLNATSFN